MSDLNVSLTIQAIASGLESVAELVAQLQGLGGETDEASEQLGALQARLDDLQAQDSLISQFVALKTETQQTGLALEEAKSRAAELGQALRETESPTKAQTREFERARQTVRELKDAYQNNQLALQSHRQAMTESGVDASRVAEEHRRIKLAMREAGAEAEGLAGSLRGQVDALAANAETARAATDAATAGLNQVGAAAQGAAGATAGAVGEVADASAKAEAEVSKVESALGKTRVTAGKLAAAVSAALGTLGAGLGLQSVLDTSSQFERRFGRLEAIIKATGKSAGLSATDIREFASALDEATLGAQDDIENAAGVLLTFRSIVGDVFTRTLSLGQDLAEVLGSSVRSSALQLGKALENPLTGLTALGRAGVSFSASQTRVIASLVETNRLADAQTLILNVLEKQVGGAAAGAGAGLAGAVDFLSKKFTDFRKALGDSLNPVAVQFYTQLSATVENLTTRVQALASSGQLQAWARSAVSALERLGGVLKSGVTILYEWKDGLILLAEVAIAAKLVAMARAAQAAIAAFLAGSAATGTWAAGLRDYAGQVRGATGATGKLRTALAGLPSSVAITFLLVGLSRALDGFESLITASGRLYRAQGKLSEAQQDLSDTQTALADRARSAAEQYQNFADTAIRSADTIREAGAEELESYQKRLEGAIEYYNAVRAGYKAVGDTAGVREAEQDVARYREALNEARSALERLALPPPKSDLDKAINAIVGKVRDLQREGQSARDTLSGLLDGLGSASLSGIEATLGALERLTTGGKAVGRVFREELATAIGQLSADALLRFQVTAEAALGGTKEQADQLAAVLQGTLSAALRGLGLSLGEMQTGLSDRFRQTLQFFDTVSSNVSASAEVIQQALLTAISRAGNGEELEAIRQRFVALGEDGVLSAEQLAEAQAALNVRIKETATVADEAAQARAEEVERTLELAATLRAEREQRAQSAAIAREQAALEAERLGQMAAQHKEAQRTSQAVNDMAKAARDRASEAAGVFRGIIGGAIQGISELGERAMAFYTEARGGAVEATEETNRFLEVSRNLGKVIDNNRRTFGQLDAYSSWVRDVNETHRQWNAEMGRATQLLDRITQGMQDGSLATYELSTATREAQSGFRLLSDEQLAPLRSAIQDATNRLRGLRDEARGTLNSIREELLQQNGDLVELERLRRQQQRAQLETGLATAEASGDRQAIADYQEAIKLFEQATANAIEAAREQQKAAEESRKREEAALSRTERSSERPERETTATASPSPAPRQERPVPGTDNVFPLNDRAAFTANFYMNGPVDREYADRFMRDQVEPRINDWIRRTR